MAFDEDIILSTALYYRQNFDDIFVLFKSSDHLKRFQNYLNSYHFNMSFSVETEQSNKISFLDVNVICQQGKFTANIYRKPTFIYVYNHFDSFHLTFTKLI